jgi:hypothetical protein
METKSLGQIQHEIADLKEKQGYIDDALSHKEYSEEYHFDFKHGLTSTDFSHSGNQQLVEACNAAHVHMHPDVVTQLIEGELFERMKSYVKIAVTGKSVTYLMEMKNDLERMMLNDQSKSIAKKAAKLQEDMKAFEEMVKSYEAPVSAEEPSSFAEVKSSKKKK